MFPAFSTTVVLPKRIGVQSADDCHQRSLLLGKEAVGLNSQLGAVGKPKVFVETTRECSRQMRVTVDQPRE
jgi:hypothetical protein